MASGLEVKRPEYEQEPDLAERFTYHPPRPELEQPARYVELRTEAHALAIKICRDVPPGRCRSLALTYLEMAIMEANAGIARGESAS